MDMDWYRSAMLYSGFEMGRELRNIELQSDHSVFGKMQRRYREAAVTLR